MEKTFSFLIMKRGTKLTKEGNIIQVTIPKWMAEKKETKEKLQGRIEVESEKAYGIQVEGRTETIWIPKSQIKSLEVIEEATEKQEKKKQETREKQPKEKKQVTTSRENTPTREIDVEKTTRLKLEKELEYINQVIDTSPERAYKIATQLQNQLQEYTLKSKEIVRKLGKKLGEKPLTSAKDTGDSSDESSSKEG